MLLFTLGTGSPQPLRTQLKADFSAGLWEDKSKSFNCPAYRCVKSKINKVQGFYWWCVHSYNVVMMMKILGHRLHQQCNTIKLKNWKNCASKYNTFLFNVLIIRHHPFCHSITAKSWLIFRGPWEGQTHFKWPDTRQELINKTVYSHSYTIYSSVV